MHELRLHGLVAYALKRGGSIHPMILPEELTNETGIMNPSIFVHDGKLLMNIRHVNYTLYHSESKQFGHQWGPLQYIHPENDVCLATHNVLCELDDDLNIVSSQRIHMALDTGKPTWNFIGLEDGRLFSWEDRLFLCGVRRDCYDDKGTGRMEMCEIEKIEGKWTEVSRNPIPAPGDNSTYCEKNWVPILDKPWHFVKWHNPTDIVHYDIEKRESTSVIVDHDKKYAMPRDLRGGTQVIRINEEQRLTISHEVDLKKDVFGRKDGNYMHRAVVWDNDWNIVKTTQEFSFMGFQKDHTTGNDYGIEFATGIAFHNNNVLISFGLQDNACFILSIPDDVFTEFLMKG